MALTVELGEVEGLKLVVPLPFRCCEVGVLVVRWIEQGAQGRSNECKHFNGRLIVARAKPGRPSITLSSFRADVHRIRYLRISTLLTTGLSINTSEDTIIPMSV